MSLATTRRLRVAIIGAGYVAGHHLAALSRLDFIDIVGICDTDLGAARLLADRYGGVAAARLADLPEPPQVVHVLTPPASHAALALEAIAMGCHVLVEKPMADSVADCETMIDSARRKGVLLGVNHSDLFDPVLQQALDIVRAGRIGEVVSVDILRSSDYPAYAGGPLPGMVSQGSYPFRDLGVHGLYTLEAFLGPLEPLQVDYHASGNDPNLGFDHWQARTRGRTGVGRLSLSWTARPLENRLCIRGTNGGIEVDRFLQTCRVHRVFPGPKFIGIVANAMLHASADLVRIPWNVLRFATGRLRPSPGIQRGVEQFALAVLDHAEPPFGGADALRIARLLEPACVAPDRLRARELEGRLRRLEPADALVTGAGGLLGRALVAALRARHQRVRVLVRRKVPAFVEDPGVQVVVGDLGDPRIVDHAVAGVTTVYHVGAAMRGSPRDFEAGTVWGTRNVIDACGRHGTRRLVHVSSMGVLDHASRGPDEKVDESYRHEPLPALRGAYTRTKLQAEQMVVDAMRDGLPAVVLRPGQIFGPGAERVTPNGVVALAGRWIAVGDGACTLPLVYVDDVVDALLLAGEAPDATGAVINVVDPATVTQSDYLARCRQRFGKEQPTVRVPGFVFMGLAAGVELLGRVLRREVPLTRYRVRSLRPLANVDGSAARRRLGWQPRVGVRSGLDRTFGPGTVADAENTAIAATPRAD